MESALLQTKLFVPSPRRSLIPRPQLIAKLNAGLNHRLTLISAPAGFGKTTLVADWLSQVERPFGWLSLDEEDNDPQRFFTYLVTPLQSLANDVEFTLPSPNLPLKAMITLLVNNLMQLPQPIVLVLDDYHLVKTEAIHEALTFLCDHLPPTLHLVLITRSDPPLPLTRMRAQGELNEIRQKDLRFTREETAVFLNQMMGLKLTTEDVATLEARTEGWIASLQLTALAMKVANSLHEQTNQFALGHLHLQERRYSV